MLLELPLLAAGALLALPTSLALPVVAPLSLPPSAFLAVGALLGPVLSAPAVLIPAPLALGVTLAPLLLASLARALLTAPIPALLASLLAGLLPAAGTSSALLAVEVLLAALAPFPLAGPASLLVLSLLSQLVLSLLVALSLLTWLLPIRLLVPPVAASLLPLTGVPLLSLLSAVGDPLTLLAPLRPALLATRLLPSLELSLAGLFLPSPLAPSLFLAPSSS